jgi:hypothetical protein
LAWYRVKLAVKTPDDATASQRRREAGSSFDRHAPREGCLARPARGKFVAAVLARANAAKPFRDRARQVLQASWLPHALTLRCYCEAGQALP